MKIACFLVVEGLGMVCFSLVSHSQCCNVFRYNKIKGTWGWGHPRWTLCFVSPLDQPSGQVLLVLPLEHYLSLLFTLSTAQVTSTLALTPLLASQSPCLWPPYLLKPHTFRQSCKRLICSHLRILFELIILTFHNNQIVMFRVLQSLSHPWECHDL